VRTALAERGYQALVVVDAALRDQLGGRDASELDRQIAGQDVIQAPAETDGDEWVVEPATEIACTSLALRPLPDPDDPPPAMSSFRSSSPEAGALRDELHRLAKRKQRIVVVDGLRYELRAGIYDSFGEEAFGVDLPRV
jgi:hypothetical protein